MKFTLICLCAAVFVMLSCVEGKSKKIRNAPYFKRKRSPRSEHAGHQKIKSSKGSKSSTSSTQSGKTKGHCKRECPALTIPLNGSISTAKTCVSTEVMYQCENGYVLKSLQKRTCQRNGKWTWEEPACSIVKCPALTSPENGQILPNEKIMMEFGDVAVYSCGPGFEPKGNNGTFERTCLASGYWSGVHIYCEKSDECGSTPCLNEGTCFGTVNGYICVCADGYNGANCETEKLDECGSTPCLNEGTCFATVNGHICVCADGYNGTNCETIMTCTALPAPVEGTVSPQVGSVINFGDVQSVICNSGTVNSGNSGDTDRVCMANGRWSGSEISCERFRCEDLTAPRNGKLFVEDTALLLGSMITWTCDAGYTPSGVTMYCLAKGWSSGKPLTCVLQG